MFKLTIQYANGNPIWIEYFPNTEKANAWIADEQTRSYWNPLNTYQIIDITPPPIPGPSNIEILANKWINLRIKRNNALAASDWTMFGDAPLNIEQKAVMANYRNILRNLPATNSNPDLIVFPTVPVL